LLIAPIPKNLSAGKSELIADESSATGEAASVGSVGLIANDRHKSVMDTAVV
jgi:hypothetical protein